MSYKKKALDVLRYASATKPLDYIQNHVLERDVLLDIAQLKNLPNVQLQSDIPHHAGLGEDNWAIVSEAHLPPSPVFPGPCLRAGHVILNNLQQSEHLSAGETEVLELLTWMVQREEKISFLGLDHVFSQAFHALDALFGAYFGQQQEPLSMWKEYGEKLLAWREIFLTLEEGQKTYQKIFDVYNQLKMDGGADLYEIVWGFGMVRWGNGGSKIWHPLVVQPCEVVLTEHTHQLCIKPAQAQAELQWAQLGLPRHGLLEDAFEQVLAEQDIDPFEHEPQQESAVPWMLDLMQKVDSRAVWVEEFSEDDPTWNTHPEISPQWCVFVRKRPQNRLVDDIKTWEQLLEKDDVVLPPAIINLLEPHTIEQEKTDVVFRGAEQSYTHKNDGAGDTDKNTEKNTEKNKDNNTSLVRELYFPLPYNDEQLQIIKKLENNNACVVQGPPGTGKTHSIANIICHYLALGKRVLVTASTTQALEVVRDKIPSSIRDLSATLLSSDTVSVRDFEKSVECIGQRLSMLDESNEDTRIQALEQTIDDLHRSAQKLDTDILNALSSQGGGIVVLGERISIAMALQVLQAGNFQSNLVVQKKDDLAFDQLVKLCQRARMICQDIGPNGVLLYQQHGSSGESKELGELPSSQAQQQYAKLLSEVRSLEAQIEGLGAGLFSAEKDYRQQLFLLEHIKAIEKELSCFDALPFDVEQSLNLVVAERKDSVSSFVKKVKLYEKSFKSLSGRVLFDENKLTSQIVEQAQEKSKRRFFGFWGTSSGMKDFCQNLTLDGQEVQTPQQWKIVVARLQQVKEVSTIVKIWNSLCDTAPSLRIPSMGYEQSMEQVFQYAKYAQVVCDKKRLQQDQRQKISKLLGGEAGFYKDVEDCDIAKWEEAFAIEQKRQHIVSQCEKAIEFWDRWKNHPLYEEGVKAWRSGDEAQWNVFLIARENHNKYHSFFLELDEVFAILEAWGGLEVKQQWQQYFQNLGYNQPLSDDFWNTLPQRWKNALVLEELYKLPKQDEFLRLQKQRQDITHRLQKMYEKLVEVKAWKKLAEQTSGETKQALASYLSAVRKIGKSGKGVRSQRFRALAKESMVKAYNAIPCWIMPEGRVFESMPAELGLFDLVVVDEASQSTITMFPALLRGKKILVVGDDRQVSPSVAGLSEKQIQEEYSRYLSDIPLGKFMTRDHSLYELFSIAFSETSVMLREHFRSVEDIISYSNKKFYHNQIVPLKVPQGEERKLSPLVDVLVPNGKKEDDINSQEAEVIVREMVKGIVGGQFKGKTLGVVTLASDPKQSALIRRMLDKELHEKVSLEQQLSHKITVGPPAVFQGSERDVMFVGMVWHKDTRGVGGREFEQRVNVALTRARQQMILVHSLHYLDAKPSGMLQSVLAHFQEENATAQQQKITRTMALGWEDIWDALHEHGIDMFVAPEHLGLDIVLEKERARAGVMLWGFPHQKQRMVSESIDKERRLFRSGWQVAHLFASYKNIQPSRFWEGFNHMLLELGLLPDPQTLKNLPSTSSNLNGTTLSKQDEALVAPNVELRNAFEARMEMFDKAFSHPKTLAELTQNCDSVFEQEVLTFLYGKYHLVNQVDDYGYRMDLVVFDQKGHHLVIELDGDAYHVNTKKDDARQRFLERRGWVFERVWASDYFRHKNKVLKQLVQAIDQAGVLRK